MLITSINVFFGQHLTHIYLLWNTINSREPQPGKDLGLTHTSAASSNQPTSTGTVLTGPGPAFIPEGKAWQGQFLSALNHTTALATTWMPAMSKPLAQVCSPSAPSNSARPELSPLLHICVLSEHHEQGRHRAVLCACALLQRGPLPICSFSPGPCHLLPGS